MKQTNIESQLEKLVEEFPKIFVHRSNKKTRIGGGFECAEGWYNLLRRLCCVIQHDIDSTHDQREFGFEYNHMITQAKLGDRSLLDERYKSFGEEFKERILTEGCREVPGEITQLEVDCIKEKFGGLRFHKRGGDDFSNGAIALAELLSFSICDQCGQTGRVGNQDLPYGSTEESGGYYATRCEKHWGRLQEDGSYGES